MLCSSPPPPFLPLNERRPTSPPPAPLPPDSGDPLPTMARFPPSLRAEPAFDACPHRLTGQQPLPCLLLRASNAHLPRPLRPLQEKPLSRHLMRSRSGPNRPPGDEKPATWALYASSASPTTTVTLASTVPRLPTSTLSHRAVCCVCFPLISLSCVSFSFVCHV